MVEYGQVGTRSRHLTHCDTHSRMQKGLPLTSAQQPTQNDPQIPDSGDSGKGQPLRTRYYHLIMTIAVVIGVVIDIVIFIGIITNTEGRMHIPHLVFTFPIVGALAIGRFVGAVLIKKSLHLVSGYAAPYFQGGQAPQQGQYGQLQHGRLAAQPTAPQSTGYGQVPGQQTVQSAPQQAPHGQPQQRGQVSPSGQHGQDPQNQQPYGQGGQSGQSGPAGY